MITNATILSITRITGADATGNPIVKAGPQVCIRCFQDSIMNAQRFTLGGTIKDAQQVLYIPKDNLGDAGEQAPGLLDQITVQGDDETAPTTQKVIYTKPHTLNDLGHHEVFITRI